MAGDTVAVSPVRALPSGLLQFIYFRSSIINHQSSQRHHGRLEVMMYLMSNAATDSFLPPTHRDDGEEKPERR